MTTQLFTAPFSRLFQGIGSALQAWSLREDLRMLDDRMLKDLGISRAQAQFVSGHERTWHIGPHHDA